MIATEPVVASSWPAYYDLLVTQTPFRSVVAMQLSGPLAATATIDLLFHDPHAAALAPLTDFVIRRGPS